MKKNKIFILLMLSQIIFSCSKKSPVILISKWMSRPESTVIERKLASMSSGQCLKNIFDAKTLKEEIAVLEKDYLYAEKVSGNWRHLDLSTLPVPQANFLNTYGNQLGDLGNPDSIDYSSCTDVPCILNQIYQDRDDVSALAHYVWYLKFGNLLAANNLLLPLVEKIPGQYGNKKYELKDYLFSKDELYGFWRLSFMLKGPFRTLPKLREIKRLPNNEAFRVEKFVNSCGIAFSEGYIILRDVCLTLYGANSDYGEFYEALSHELAHHIDYHEGKKIKKLHRSKEDDYLKIAGMSFTEKIENEVLKTIWTIKPEAKFVSTYAQTSGVENFAESLSFFRIDGDLTKKSISEDHFKFVSNNFFQGKSFEKEQIMESWISNQEHSIAELIIDGVSYCKDKKILQENSYFNASDFSFPITPDLLNCFGYQASEIATKMTMRSALYEPEGCRILDIDQTKIRWEEMLRGYLLKNFNGHLHEYQKDVKYIEKIKKYLKVVENKEIAISSYLGCYGEKEEEDCYKKVLYENAYAKASDLNLSSEYTEELARMYVSYHNYLETKGNLNFEYNKLVLSILSKVIKSAENVWNTCYALPQDDIHPPQGSYFDVSSGYMISSLYNCLNIKTPDSLLDLVSSISLQGQNIKHPKEEVILLNKIRPHFSASLTERFKVESAKELSMANKIISSDNGALRKSMLQEFNWIKGNYSSQKIISECEKVTIKQIPFAPLFHLKKDLFSEFISDYVCKGIDQSAEMLNWFEKSKEERKARISEDFQDRLFMSVKSLALECVKKYPVNTSLNRTKFRTQRDACLFNNWDRVEQKVINELSKTQEFKDLKLSKDFFQLKLEAERRRLQLRVVKEHF